MRKVLTTIAVLLMSLSMMSAFLTFCFAEDDLSVIDKALDQYERTTQRLDTVIAPFVTKTERQDVAQESTEEFVKENDNLPKIFNFLEQQQNKEKQIPSEEGSLIDETDSAEKNEVIIHVNDQEDAGEFADNAVIDVLQLKDMDIKDVLKLISDKSGLNIIAGNNVQGKITIYLNNVGLREALRIILDANNLAYKVEDGIARVMPAQEFEYRYGYHFGGNTQTRIVRLLYADANDAVQFLNQIKSVSGKVVHDPKSNTLVLTDSQERLSIMQDLIGKIDVPVQTEVFHLNYADAEEVSTKIEEILTQNVGRVRFDKRSNKVIVSDTAMKIGEIAKLIHAFDVKDKQVLIEAKIIQIVLSDQHKFGVDWEAIVQDYHNLDMVGDFDVLGSSEKSGKISIGTVSSDQYTVLLEALETVGTSNILSNPSITSMNNEEAKILVGSTEPYVTTTTTTPASGPTTTSESVNFIDVGVKLYVTPTIHKDKFITMKIKPEVSSVTSTITTGNNNTIPVVGTSEAETTVVVKDGVTIVIGGLIKEEKIETLKKVPLLGDIPVLGRMFRNDDDLVRKTEIVIFLTPKIISGDVSEDRTTDALLTHHNFKF